ncbi:MULTISPECIES: tripartite tricarboxylate transporter TctB family protein [Hydrogenophaga]|uniref:Membrane protein n=1 Tax=Hydrogenophaga electricum TaxID=1230953 RepID=A0ABQ6BXW2_9BURK|nr:MULTISPECIES: tripartite tricarboxylate transporter TctB family protein [Hydrogenophaga]GLS12986.1 membrane protein [Hydrogenophaga electricum]
MAVASQKDFFSGLMFMIVGGGFAWGAVDYEIGQAARMGPGYFPFMLGLLLVALGALVVLGSLRSGPPGGDKIGAFAWRPLVCILGANLVFGALLVGLPSIGLPAFGLIVALFALVIISSMAREGFSFKESMILAAILAAGSYVGFVYLLNLQFPVWPAFLTN